MNKMKRRFLLLFLLFAIPLAALPAQAITLSLNPSHQSVGLGDISYVDLDISGLDPGTALSLGGFEIDISYDPSILGFNSVTFGDPVLGDQLSFVVPSFAYSDDSLFPDVVTVSEVSFDDEKNLNDLQAMEFTLATLAFDSLSLGKSFLQITYYDLSDASGSFSLPVDGVLKASISVVPEPATSLLLIAGIASMGVFGRKRFNSSKA